MAAYPDHGESGKLVGRRFCPTCGSSLGSEAEAYPGAFILKAGSLDDCPSVKPAMQVWMRSAQPWVKFAEAMPGVETGR